jgi:hypothetical protein
VRLRAHALGLAHLQGRASRGFALRSGTLFAIAPGMAQAFATDSFRSVSNQPGSFEGESADADQRLRIEEECLEVSAVSPSELNVLRAWVRRINGTTYAQPYFVEGPPGHFRLYVGEAAERVRTAQGIQ